jgi:hypothetical protein
MKKLFALGLLVALAGAVYAMPTFFGPTGGLLVQDATIQQGVALSVTDNFDGGSDIPMTDLVFGVKSNLEVGGFYSKMSFNKKSEDGAWGAFAKYVLPYTLASGKLAAGLTYVDSENTSSWIGALSGTFPVFASSQFTAEVLFSRVDDENHTSYLAGLDKPFKNGTALGLEYYFNLASGITNFGGSNDFGTAYVSFPINEMLSARAALTGIGSDTTMLGTVTAKF